jgi:membrane-bound lytic murein transglycosylase C
MFILLLFTVFFQSDFNTYKANEKKAQDDFDSEQDFRAQNSREYQAYLEDVEKTWGDGVVSTRKQWVNYSKDKSARAIMDFEKNQATIEVTGVSSREEAERRAEFLLKNMESAQGANKQSILRQSFGGDASSSLRKQRFGSETRSIRHTMARDKSIRHLAEPKHRKGKWNPKYKPKQNVTVYKVVVPFKSGALDERASQYASIVQKYAKKYNVNPKQVMAHIDTESSFNPRAVSSANAYGLMQLVPATAGTEAYKLATGKQWIPSQAYLFDPEKNIELGCAYLNIIQTRYFGDITDPTKRVYLSISAYNAGPSNVAKTFTGNFDIKASIPSIKKLSPAQLYQALYTRVPKEEAKNYLKKVTERMKKY